MLQRQQGSCRGTERLTQGMVPFSGLVLGPSPLANASRPAATQATIQQPRTHGRMFALTQQDAQTLNVVVEGMITLSGYTARTLFDPGGNSLIYF